MQTLAHPTPAGVICTRHPAAFLHSKVWKPPPVWWTLFVYSMTSGKLNLLKVWVVCFLIFLSIFCHLLQCVRSSHMKLQFLYVRKIWSLHLVQLKLTVIMKSHFSGIECAQEVCEGNGPFSSSALAQLVQSLKQPRWASERLGLFQRGRRTCVRVHLFMCSERWAGRERSVPG